MAIGLDFCVGCGCCLYFQDESRRYCPSCEEAEMVYPVINLSNDMGLPFGDPTPEDDAAERRYENELEDRASRWS